MTIDPETLNYGSNPTHPDSVSPILLSGQKQSSKNTENNASNVLFRRLAYFLSPQLDIYEKLPSLIRGKNRVLEVGFGTGAGVLQYARAANHVTAIEIDPAAVRFAQRCFPLENVKWQEADLMDFAHLGQDYDFIIMIEVLEHLNDAELAIWKVCAALKRGGHTIITLPNESRERKRDDPLIEREWDARELYRHLIGHFDDVRFLDFELRELSGIPDTTATPLIALCS